MKFVSRIVIAVIGLSAAACGSVATPVWSEQAQGTQSALAATADHLTEIAPTATPTQVPTSTPTGAPTATPLPPTEVPTEAPTTVPATATPEPIVVQSAPAGDPAKGKVHFEQMRPEVNFACATCHYVDKEDQLIGPGLLNVGTRAETRVEGQSAYDYLHASIVDPSAYVVKNFPDKLMPQTYKDLWTEEEINDIIAYLLTLK